MGEQRAQREIEGLAREALDTCPDDRYDDLELALRRAVQPGAPAELWIDLQDLAREALAE